MNVGSELAIDGLDCGTTKEPVAEGNSMTAQIHQRATAAVIDIPEPGAMRTKMFFTLFDEVDFPKPPSSAISLAFKYFGVKKSSSA